MSEFLTQTALAQRLVEKTGVSLEVAKKFSTVFFTIVRKGLKTTNSFSIYNFGTFKKTWIENSIGLNPQNGLRIEIPAHWRIKFIPCAQVARRINKPYANLKAKVFKQKTTKKNTKLQKVSANGLYAKAKRYAEYREPIPEPLSIEDEERLGLLAIAENIRAEQAMRQAQEDKAFAEMINSSTNKETHEEKTILENQNEIEVNETNENVTEYPEIIDEQLPKEESTQDNSLEIEAIQDEIEEEQDDIEENEKSRFPVKVLALTGAAVLVIIFLISILLKACSFNENEKSEQSVETQLNEETNAIVKTEDSTQNNNEEKTNIVLEETNNTNIFIDYTVPTGGDYHSIAESKYGNRHLWPIIYSANKNLNSDPDFIHAYNSIKIPELQTGLNGEKQIADSMLDAYNGYLMMCEKNPGSPNNIRRKQLAVRVIVSAELVQPGFINKYSSRILPEYLEKAKKIAINQYKLDL